MYAIQESRWTTPGGNFARLMIRADSSDWNTVASIMTPHDEYGIAGLDLGTHALDVGSHVGAFAIAALLDNPGLVMTAIEPVPPNVELLHRNLDLNGVGSRCSVVEAAVGGGTETTIRYQFTGDENATHHAFIGNTGIVYPLAPDGVYTEQTVPVVSLGNYPGTTFMKIDCEGGEWGFLADPAVGKVDRIHGEVHPVQGHLPKDIFDLLAATHEVTLNGANQEAGPCGFVAVRR